MELIPYGRQEITEEDISAVIQALKSDFLTQGPKIDEFEKAFASYIGSKYAVAVSNGTAALHVSTLALDVSQGTEVITSPLTFAASANCVSYCGGKVDFCDIDRKSYVMDIGQLEDKLKRNPNKYAGVVPVDFSGYPVNMEEVRSLADKYGLWILEDACHAPGGSFIDSKGIEQQCGNGIYADLAIYSFHPVKHIASGEGGMVTTNDKDLYEKLLRLRTHGISRDPKLLKENHGGWYYQMFELGYNYRLTDIQAALGLSQLKRADSGLVRRREIAGKYDEAFAKYGIVRQSRENGFKSAYHLYIIEVDNRKGLYDYLRSKNIFPQVHYIPVHTLYYYRQFGFQPMDYPEVMSYYDRCLSLPMYPSLTDEQQLRVIEEVKTYLD